MATDIHRPDEPRALLGLRSPTQIGDTPTPDTPQPERPDYPVISSGWDNEDASGNDQRSNFLTAVGAGAVLLLGMVAIGLLIG
ncbi:hypothetical protein ACVFYP_01425 [Roseomonas sp. F4]